MTAVEQGRASKEGAFPCESEKPSVPHEVGGFPVVDLQSAHADCFRD